jgi:pyruvate dehydrogenase complex dehydrogenase (E1) component
MSLRYGMSPRGWQSTWRSRHSLINARTLQELALAGDLKRDAVTEAIMRYDLDPDATAEVP